MNRRRKICCIASMSLFVISSCINGGNVIKTFPYTTEIKPFKEYILPFPPYEYSRVFVSGGLLFTHNLRGDFAFNVYTLPELDSGFKAGMIGRGPNEFVISPHVMSPTVGDGCLEIYDSHTDRIMRVEFEEGLLRVIEEIELPLPDGIFGNSLARLQKNIYLCFNDDPNASKEIVWSDCEKRVSKEIIDYPKFMWEHASATGFSIDGIGTGTIVPKPDGSRFAVFHFYYKYFRLFNEDGDQLKEVKVKIEPYTDYSSGNIIDSYRLDLFAAYKAVFAYDTIAASDDYIYAVCRNDRRDGSQTMSDLQVWDWDGNPVALYQFEDAQMFSYIELELMKMYSFHFLDEDQDVGAVRVYDLSGLRH